MTSVYTEATTPRGEKVKIRPCKYQNKGCQESVYWFGEEFKEFSTGQKHNCSFWNKPIITNESQQVNNNTSTIENNPNNNNNNGQLEIIIEQNKTLIEYGLTSIEERRRQTDLLMNLYNVIEASRQLIDLNNKYLKAYLDVNVDNKEQARELEQTYDHGRGLNNDI